MITKYIITDSGAVLFNSMTVHKQVAAGFEKIYAAGFVDIKFNNTGRHEIKCHGHSDSLDIESIPVIDEFIIMDTLTKVSQIQYFGLSVKQMYEDYHKSHSV